MGFWRFVLQHPFGAAFITISMALTVGGLLSDAYSFYEWGVPPLVWTAIGAFLFMCTLVVMFYRFEQSATPSAPLQGARPRAKSEAENAETDELSKLRALGKQALSVSHSLRDYLGNAYEYGLGLPLAPMPSQTRALLAPLAFRFHKLGLDIPSIPQNASDGKRAEAVMLFCEHAGRIMVTGELTATEIAVGVRKVQRDIAASLAKTQFPDSNSF